MQITTSKTPLKVLITRPKVKAQQLALSLNKQGIASINQPLFDYQALANGMISKTLLTTADLLIFVSVAAVEFAHARYPAHHWVYERIYAVGGATTNALQALGIVDVITPQQENSEGLLTLPSLAQSLGGKSITIVRGNGGREHLADTLISRGGKVSYLESYQRVWRVFSKDIGKQWYEQEINCIVVTSNAILEKIVQLILEKNETKENLLMNNYWQAQCLWVVTSERIAEKAKQLGLLQVLISAGAGDQVITETLQLLHNK
jgi:uroporphyrinogen-III synthase